MADFDETKLTDDQIGKVIEWLTPFTRNYACIICSNREFEVAPHVVTPPIIGLDKSINISGTSYPFVLLSCKRCGHTHFFNAVRAGLFEREHDKQPA